MHQGLSFILIDKLLLFQVIDASMNVEDVHKDITEHSLNAVNVAQNLPLEELWQ